MAKYVANPVEVDAWKIVGMSGRRCDGGYDVALDSGQDYIITAAQSSRMIPGVNDYLVRQPDGYEYLNPKHVFESKYRPI